MAGMATARHPSCGSSFESQLLASAKVAVIIDTLACLVSWLGLPRSLGAASNPVAPNFVLRIGGVPKAHFEVGAIVEVNGHKTGPTVSKWMVMLLIKRERK